MHDRQVTNTKIIIQMYYKHFGRKPAGDETPDYFGFRKSDRNNDGKARRKDTLVQQLFR